MPKANSSNHIDGFQALNQSGTSASYFDTLQKARERQAADAQSVYDAKKAKSQARQHKMIELRQIAYAKAEKEAQESRDDINRSYSKILSELEQNFKKTYGMFLMDEVRANVTSDANQLRTSLENEIKEDVRAQLVDDLEPVVKAQLKAQHATEIKRTLQQEMVPEVREDLTAQLIKDLETVVKAQLRAEYTPEVRQKLRGDLSGDVAIQLRNEMKDDVQNHLREEMYHEIEAELKAELSGQVRVAVTEEMRSEAMDELKNELRAVVQEQLKDELRPQIMQSIESELADSRHGNGDEEFETALENQTANASAHESYSDVGSPNFPQSPSIDAFSITGEREGGHDAEEHLGDAQLDINQPATMHHGLNMAYDENDTTVHNSTFNDHSITYPEIKREDTPQLPTSEDNSVGGQIYFNPVNSHVDSNVQQSFGLNRQQALSPGSSDIQRRGIKRSSSTSSIDEDEENVDDYDNSTYKRLRGDGYEAPNGDYESDGESTGSQDEYDEDTENDDELDEEYGSEGIKEEAEEDIDYQRVGYYAGHGNGLISASNTMESAITIDDSDEEAEGETLVEDAQASHIKNEDGAVVEDEESLFVSS